MTADKPHPATTGRTLLRSTQRTTPRSFVVTNKRKHKITQSMIAPIARCQSLPAAKHDTVAKFPSLVSRYSEWLRAGRSEDRTRFWGEIFLTHPVRPCVPPKVLLNVYRVFPGVKAAEAWCWPPNPSYDEVKESVELYFTVFRSMHFDIHMH